MANKQREPSGMYGETPSVQVGQYSISKQADNSISIEHESGEGGEFKKDLLEQYIHSFYKRFF